jgi:hypothetical protein
LKDPPPGQLIRTVRGQGYMVPSDADIELPILTTAKVSPLASGTLAEIR